MKRFIDKYLSMRLCLPLLLLAATLPCVVGCSTSDCDDNRNSLPLAAFYASGAQEPAVLNSLSVRGLGAPADSLLLDSATNVDEVYLPFRIDQQASSFIFDFDNSARPDTVTFSYELSPRFASSECGVVYDYYIVSIAHTCWSIDSVVCPTRVITNAPGVNIHIYLQALQDSI